MIYSARLVEPPLAEPLTVDEARLRLRIPEEEDDQEIEKMIRAARQFFEDHDDRRLMWQRWRVIMDGFPLSTIELPYRPVRTVYSIKYYDEASELQTLDPELYQVDIDSFLSRLAPVDGQSWPATARRFNAVEIEFAAGYGTIDPGEYLLTVEPGWSTAFTISEKLPTGFTAEFATPAPYPDTLSYRAVAGADSYQVVREGMVEVDEDAAEITVVYGSPLFDQSAAPGDIPEHLRLALLLHIGHIYENREDTIIGQQMMTIPRGYDALIGANRRIRV